VRTGCKSARILGPRTGTAEARSSGLAFKCAALSAACWSPPLRGRRAAGTHRVYGGQAGDLRRPGGRRRRGGASCVRAHQARGQRKSCAQHGGYSSVSANFGPLGAVWQKGMSGTLRPSIQKAAGICWAGPRVAAAAHPRGLPAEPSWASSQNAALNTGGRARLTSRPAPAVSLAWGLQRCWCWRARYSQAPYAPSMCLAAASHLSQTCAACFALACGHQALCQVAHWQFATGPAQFRPPSCMVHVGYGDVLKVHYMVRARPKSCASPWLVKESPRLQAACLHNRGGLRATAAYSTRR